MRSPKGSHTDSRTPHVITAIPLRFSRTSRTISGGLLVDIWLLRGRLPGDPGGSVDRACPGRGVYLEPSAALIRFAGTMTQDAPYTSWQYKGANGPLHRRVMNPRGNARGYRLMFSATLPSPDRAHPSVDAPSPEASSPEARRPCRACRGTSADSAPRRTRL